MKPIKLIINLIPDEIPIGSISGTRIVLHPSFLVMIWMFGSIGWNTYSHSFYGVLRGELCLIMLFAIVTAHEFGHIFAGRSYGIETKRVILTPLGGMAEMNVGNSLLSARKEFFVTIAGPLVNAVFFVGTVFFIPAGWIHHPTLSLRGIATGFVIINLVMFCFNFLPVFPMDGGRILRSALASKFNYLKATKITCTVAYCISPVIMVWGYKEAHYAVMVMMPVMCLYSRAEVRRVREILALPKTEPINATATVVSEQ